MATTRARVHDTRISAKCSSTGCGWDGDALPSELVHLGAQKHADVTQHTVRVTTVLVDDVTP